MAVPYREGSVFAVPLRNGGYAVGVVARFTAEKYHGGGGLLGYFFGPKHETVPTAEVIDTLDPLKALVVLKFGDLSLLSGEWPIVGSVTDWKRENWPLPDFVRKDDISKRAWRVRYSDDNLVQPISEESAPYDSPLQEDSIAGAGFVELRLTRLLG